MNDSLALVRPLWYSIARMETTEKYEQPQQWPKSAYELPKHTGLGKKNQNEQIEYCNFNNLRI